MSLYAWKGLDSSGKAVGGTRDADGGKSLRQALRKDGIFITELSEVLGGVKKKAPAAAGARPQSAFRRDVNFQQLLERVRPQEIAVFTRQLGTLLTAGIPLAEALGALAEQAENKKLEQILAGIRQKVNEGTALAEAMSAHPTLFADLYINMVRSG